MRVEHVTADLLAQRAAVWVADRVWAAVADRGVAHVAVSGGRTPAAMFSAIAGLALPWDRMHVWQVDERVLPDGDPGRNAGQIAVLPAVLHLMAVSLADLDGAASAYAAEMVAGGAAVLDIVHLGLGDDGHTASWPPGGVPSGEAAVAVVRAFRGHDRLTLTPAVVARARERMFLVSGAGKVAVLDRLLGGDRSLPASLVPAESTAILTDIGT
ncbi:MAG TPA: 6-phosphogluconolactonase [Acidimicrobiales bacterium]